jgi:hypothetical protein
MSDLMHLLLVLGAVWVALVVGIAGVVGVGVGTAIVLDALGKPACPDTGPA